MRSLVLVVLVSTPALAMEGQWRPSQLGDLSAQLGEMGLEIPVEQLADIHAQPLGAIVDLDRCSGAFVSPDGLIATAYHCVTAGLQFASGTGEDLMERGFYAPGREQERWTGPDSSVRVTTAVSDVTTDVMAGTRKLKGAERLQKVEDNIKTLVRKCESGPDLHCEVATYGGGTEYELVEQLELRDVRLVYAPPRSVGYFGGDADNWRWPRHSGDFAFLRAYASPQGRSAEHHPANVPYNPPVHLPVADGGPEPGEFVMVAGYPAYSFRWWSAAELDYYQEEHYPLRIAIRRDMLDILGTHMAREAEVASKLGPRRLSLSNDLVYYEGTVAQFHRMDVAESRWRFEGELNRWIAADADRSAAYGDVVDTVHRLQAEEAATGERDYVIAQMVSQVDMLEAAVEIYRLAVESAKPDRERAAGYQNRDRPRIANELDQVDAQYDWRVDRDLLDHFLTRAMSLPSGLHVPELDNWLDHRKRDEPLAEAIDGKLYDLYDNVDLADSDERRALMATSTFYLERSGNPWFELAAALHPYLERVDKEDKQRQDEWRAVKPRYQMVVQAYLSEANNGRHLFYPDANRTLRVSVGRVDGYAPRDGLVAAAHTTLTGITGKVGAAPFDAPEELMEAIRSGEFGSYSNATLGSVPVNFCTTLDTARGSSGSATMNAQGEFVGIIFDGNYESIASDWVFDDQMTRSIHTDLSYILWYLDRVAGARALLEELGAQAQYASTIGEADASP